MSTFKPKPTFRAKPMTSALHNNCYAQKRYYSETDSKSSDEMQIDFKKRHIETEKKFYKRMNKKRLFLLSLIIAGAGSLFLYVQYWLAECSKTIELWLWTLVVGILFIALTLIGYFVFEYERKKYTEKK